MTISQTANRPSRRIAPWSAVLAAFLVIPAAFAAPIGAKTESKPAAARTRAAKKTLAHNRRAIAAFTAKGGEAPRGENEREGGSERERYENRALPNDVVTLEQQQAAYLAFQSVSKRPGGKKTNWQPIGPVTGYVPDVVTYTGRSTINSGRVTALAVSPNCHEGDCKIFLAAAGGGVWEADNALASRPNWAPSSDGLTSNAIGALIFDPSDPKGRTLYAGTGEPNSSADSEAGVGLFRSTDFGKSWALLPATAAISYDRSIGAIAVDPTNSSHIYFGTAIGLHGAASVGGGAVVTPNSIPAGVYESLDGGATFAPTLTLSASLTNGDIYKIALDPADPLTVYVATLTGGIWRRSPRLDGDNAYHQILSENSASFDRSDLALTRKNGKTRIYAVLGGGGVPGTLWRADNADQTAAVLLASKAVPTAGGWQNLSNPVKGTPGFASYNFCTGQCWYDMFVGTPAGHPDNVWIGGSMTYGEIFTAHPPSNGRAVQRSTNAGVSFTDMTNDAQSPPLGMHPDQHAIAFAGNPEIAFVGSDGGVVRTSGAYSNVSSDCDNRGLTGVDLTQCREWLSAVPTQIFSLNDGLATLQFQHLAVNPQNPLKDVIGGTQDNGTWAYDGKGKGSWFESVGGDGGVSGINVSTPAIRFHTYFDAQIDVNFRTNDPLGWNWVSDRFFFGQGGSEARSFYIPVITDPRVGGTMFAGLTHVWRTKDNGGDQATLEQHCNEFFGDFTIICGDWIALGGPTLTTSAFGSKAGQYVVATERAPSDNGTLWAATRRGRLFISKNASAEPAGSVTFTRIDTDAQPGRFISGIAIDSANPNHAFVSFSGYNSATLATPGHVFEVTFNPITGIAAWADRSYNLGDLPITDVARDEVTGDLYVSNDFGVAMLPAGTTSWVPAAGSLPPVAVYGLTIQSNARVLYAATHGRAAWKLDLSK
ncbi:MAG: exo-alpha-sialidase [Acidobacteriota bacterium]